MSWFANLFTSSTAEPIEAVGNVIDKLFTSDEERAIAEQVKLKILQQPALVQAEISKVQAQHRSTFVAGARPFMMWVCGFGFMFAFIVNPILQWIMPEHGTPELAIDVMMELTIAMLGLSGLRTYEKIKGASK